MYYLFVLGSILALIFPRNICYSIAKLLAVLRFYIARRDRQIVINNLSPVVGDKKFARKYARKIFINFSYYLADFCRDTKLSSDFIKKYVKVTGLERLNQSLAQGKGAIALTAHLGNYEMAATVTSLLDYSLSVVALPHKDARLNRFFDRRRRATGMEVISTGATIRGCFQALERGRLLALLGDRDFSGKGVRLKMFSKYAYFPRGAVFFALKTRANIIPSFLIRENKYFYHLIFEEPITCDENSTQDEASIIKQYILVLEKYIKKYPDQWYIFGEYWLNEEVESSPPTLKLRRAGE